MGESEGDRFLFASTRPAAPATPRSGRGQALHASGEGGRMGQRPCLTSRWREARYASGNSGGARAPRVPDPSPKALRAFDPPAEGGLRRTWRRSAPPHVITGLVPVIHGLRSCRETKAWMAGTMPGHDASYDPCRASGAPRSLLAIPVAPAALHGHFLRSPSRLRRSTVSSCDPRRACGAPRSLANARRPSCRRRGHRPGGERRAAPPARRRPP